MQPPVQLTSLVFLQVLVAIGATLLTRFTLRQRHAARGGAWLLVMSAAVAFWSYGAIAEVLLTTPDLKALAAYLEWIAVMLSPLGYLMLVGVYTGSTWLQRPAVQAMALAVAAAALAVVATNELHGLVWDGYLPGSPTGRGFVEPRWGIAFPFIAGFGYVYAAIGVGVLTRAFLRAPAAYRGTFAAVVVAAALPFAVSGIFFIG